MTNKNYFSNQSDKKQKSLLLSEEEIKYKISQGLQDVKDGRIIEEVEANKIMDAWIGEDLQQN